jgi:hypothetical protein
MREVVVQTETSVPRREVLGRQAGRSDHAANLVHESFAEISVHYIYLGECWVLTVGTFREHARFSCMSPMMDGQRPSYWSTSLPRMLPKWV